MGAVASLHTQLETPKSDLLTTLVGRFPTQPVFLPSGLRPLHQARPLQSAAVTLLRPRKRCHASP